MTPEQAYNKDWEKAFNEKFPYAIVEWPESGPARDVMKDIKSFISSLLQSEREAAVKVWEDENEIFLSRDQAYNKGRDDERRRMQWKLTNVKWDELWYKTRNGHSCVGRLSLLKEVRALFKL